MKITIDTKHDSKEDIRKVIGILKHMVGDEALVNKSVSMEIPTMPIVKSEVKAEPEFNPQNDMFQMFGEHDKLPTTNIEKMIDKNEESEESETKVEIISY